MRTKIGINGLGRIGRNLLRVWLENQKIANYEIVAVNDIADIDNIAYLLEYDSLHPKTMKVTHDNNELVFKTRDGEKLLGKIHYFSEPNLENIRWEDFDVDVVVEATGVFSAAGEASKHNAEYVVVSAPSSGADFTIVYGVNDEKLNLNKHRVISNASCTTNCLAPMVKVLDDFFGVVKGSMTTIHAYTNDQVLHDQPHKDFRRGRAAATNIIPTTTGAAKAVGLVLPNMIGKLDGYALRVPVLTGSIVDLTVQLKRDDLTKEAVNRVFKSVAFNYGKETLGEVMEYSEAPLVSSDIINNPHSVIFDSSLTHVDGSLVKVVGWYDNEWGYVNRLHDLLQMM